MPKLTLVRGIPGSGKTTFVKKNFNCLYLEADMYFEKDGKYSYNNCRIQDAHLLCFKLFLVAAAERCDIVVSNTFTRLWEMEKYLRMADKYGYHVDVIRMDNNYGTTHNVPQNVIEGMKNRFEDFTGEIRVSA